MDGFSQAVMGMESLRKTSRKSRDEEERSFVKGIGSRCKTEYLHYTHFRQTRLMVSNRESFAITHLCLHLVSLCVHTRDT